MIAPAGGPDTKLSERHESHLHSPIGRTRLLAVGLSGPPSRDRWLSGERPVPIHSIDCDKVDFVFVNFGVEGETVGKWYESDAFVEWLCSYCMGGRIVEISREGDGEIWGWEFDRRRRYRELGLVPIGKWCSSNTGLSRRRTVRRSASK